MAMGSRKVYLVSKVLLIPTYIRYGLTDARAPYNVRTKQGYVLSEYVLSEFYCTSTTVLQATLLCIRKVKHFVF